VNLTALCHIYPRFGKCRVTFTMACSFTALKHNDFYSVNTTLMLRTRRSACIGAMANIIRTSLLITKAHKGHL
jgi:hypothetical protein